MRYSRVSTSISRRARRVVVIGPSGSGKSTFLRCLNLLEEPTGGEIIFEGQNITAKDTDINLVRRRMGMVFQQFNLVPAPDCAREYQAGTGQAQGHDR